MSKTCITAEMDRVQGNTAIMNRCPFNPFESDTMPHIKCKKELVVSNCCPALSNCHQDGNSRHKALLPTDQVPEPSMYTLLPNEEGKAQQTLNVRAAWVAGAPVHGPALFTLSRPSQVRVSTWVCACARALRSSSCRLLGWLGRLWRPSSVHAVLAQPGVCEHVCACACVRA